MCWHFKKTLQTSKRQLASACFALRSHIFSSTYVLTHNQRIPLHAYFSYSALSTLFFIISLLICNYASHKVGRKKYGIPFVAISNFFASYWFHFFSYTQINIRKILSKFRINYEINQDQMTWWNFDCKILIVSQKFYPNSVAFLYLNYYLTFISLYLTFYKNRYHPLIINVTDLEIQHC